MTMLPPTRLSGWMSSNGGRAVVEEQDGDLLLLEELLEGEELAAVAERVAGEEPELGQAVEDDVPGLGPLDLGEDGLGRVAEFRLGRVEDRRLALADQCPRRRRSGRRSPARRATSRADAQASSRSARDSVRVTYRHGSPALTRPSTYWRATVVLPDPGSAWSR